MNRQCWTPMPPQRRFTTGSTCTPCPPGIEAIQLDGNIYYPVEYDGITTMDDLEARVRACFSSEISDALLSDGSYREIDGKLCCAGGAGARTCTSWIGPSPPGRWMRATGR